MGAIDQIVSVAITEQTQVATQVGFGIPLIIGTTGFGNADLIRYYTNPADMLTDGFTTSSPEYIRAVKLMSQGISPTQFGIGKYTAAVIQVTTVTPDVSDQVIQHYIETIADVPYDFTSDATPTAAEVVTGLIALINADSNAPVVASGSTTLILTAKVAGAGFSHTESANLAAVTSPANHSIADDIAAIQDVNDDWYGLSAVTQVASDLEQIAQYIESQKKIYIGDTNDAACLTTSTTDIASILKGLSLKRSGVIYTAESNDGKASAWMGGQLPKVPGSTTWKFKTLAGCTVDKFTATQRSIAIGNGIAGVVGKNLNIYEATGGSNITKEGFMAGGQFIDITIGVDWLESNIQSGVFNLLVSEDKVPYTDQGLAQIENAIRAVLNQGAVNGLVDGSTIVVSIPPVAQQSVSDRANRILNNVKFSCRLAGALHFVVIQGVVTV